MFFLNYKKITYEIFWIGFGHVVSVLGSFVGLRVLTKNLLPEDYGRLALGLTIATFITQIVFVPLSNGISRFFAPSQDRNDLYIFFNDTRSILIKYTIIIIIVYIPLFFYFILYENDWLIITTASLIFAIFTGYNSILGCIQNAARQRSIVALHQGIDPWIKFLAPVFLMLFFTKNSNTGMIGYAVASILVFLSQLVFFNKLYSKINIGNKSNSNYKKDIFNFSWPISVYGIFIFFQLISDRWSIKHFASIELVGLYTILYQIGYYPISLITNVIGQLISPIIYQKAGDNNDEKKINHVENLIWKISFIIFIFTILAFLVSYNYHMRIFLFFVDSKYTSISHLLPWMLLGAGLFSISQILTISFMVQMKTKLIMKLKIITAILGVIMNILGAYLYNINGIVIASILLPIIYIIWVVIILKKNILKVLFKMHSI